MINIRDTTFYAVLRPCGCLSTCVRADSPAATLFELKSYWINMGMPFDLMSGQEILETSWTCPTHTKVTA